MKSLSSSKHISASSLSWLLSFIYFVSYVTRINFSAIVGEVVQVTGFEKSDISIVLVCLSATYGLGQVINGFLGDRIDPTKLILSGLATATVANLLLPFFAHSIPLMTVIWGINGFAQSMMWPPMVRLLVANTDDAEYGAAVVKVHLGTSFATIMIYVISPLIIKLTSWQGVFGFSALIGIIGCIIWSFMMRRICVPSEKVVSESDPDIKKFRFPRTAIFPIIFIFLATVLQGMLRDGVSAWMPTYLSEVFGIGSETSILMTVSLAIFSMLSFIFFERFYEKFFKNEIFCIAFIFGISLIPSLLMYIFFDGGAIIAVLMMSLLTACMHGTNILLTGVVPKRFKKYGNISTISGVLNACTYIGAALFTYGIAKLSELIGWKNTVGVWVIVIIAGMACGLIATRPWKKFIEK